MPVIVVTGATGFVGRNLVARLAALESHSEIVGVGRDVRRLEELVDTHAGFEGVAVDLTHPDAAKRIAEAVGERPTQAVVHLASRVTAPSDDIDESVELLRGNGLGTIAVWRLVERLRAAAGVASVIHASSILVYGNACSQPALEEQLLAPTDVYGVSKMAGELYAQYFSGRLAVPLAILRLGFIYGPLDSSGKVIYRFAAAASRGEDLVIGSDPAVFRDYVHVDDVCRVLTELIRTPEPGQRVLNVSGGRGVSLRELAETARREADSKARIRVTRPTTPAVDPFYGCIVADAGRCRHLMGEPTPLGEGLAQLMAADHD